MLRRAIPESVLKELAVVVNSLHQRDAPRSRQVLYTHGPVPPDRPPLSALMEQWLSPHALASPNTRGPARFVRELVQPLLGVRPVLLQDLLLVKHPGQQPFPWHQDFPFWPVDRPDGLIVWVPFEDTEAESGGLAFARASHLLGPRPVVDLHTGAPQDRLTALGFEPSRFEIISPRYRRGDAIAFLPTVFHGSPAMAVARPRPAWSSVWLCPHVRWSHANAPNHPLCRRVVDGAKISEQGHVD